MGQSRAWHRDHALGAETLMWLFQFIRAPWPSPPRHRLDDILRRLRIEHVCAELRRLDRADLAHQLEREELGYSDRNKPMELKRGAR